jgi:hypothetical protein
MTPPLTSTLVEEPVCGEIRVAHVFAGLLGALLVVVVATSIDTSPTPVAL